MTAKQLENQTMRLIDSGRARIAEVKTKDHTRRGMLLGVRPDRSVLFLWVPELAKDVRRFEHLSIEAVTVISVYKPKEIISIKRV